MNALGQLAMLFVQKSDRVQFGNLVYVNLVFFCATVVELYVDAVAERLGVDMEKWHQPMFSGGE